MSRAVRSPRAALIIFFCLACHRNETSAGDDGSAATIDTLPSGAVVVHNSEHGRWDSASAWHVTRDLRIGSADGNTPASFGSIVAVTADAWGRIYVLDGQAGEVRVFDSTGAWIRTLGRTGHGPGELAQPSGMDWGPNDDLWVNDPGNSRFTAWDTSGALVGSRRVERGFERFPWMGRLDRDGRAYDVDRFGEGRDGHEALVRFDSGFAVRDTFPLPQFEQQTYTVDNAAGQPMMTIPVPFTPRLVWRLDRDAHLWFAITDQYRIVERNLAGDTVRVIERQAPSIPVHRSERRTRLDGLKGITPPGFKLDPSRVPSHKAAIRDFTVDSEGDVWVLPEIAQGGDPFIADVFDPAGRYLGRVRLPSLFSGTAQPVILRDAAYVIESDPLGVQYVDRWRIQR